MPNPAAVRAERLRKTKAQLIDEIDTLEQSAAAIKSAHKCDRPIRRSLISPSSRRRTQIPF